MWPTPRELSCTSCVVRFRLFVELALLFKSKDDVRTAALQAVEGRHVVGSVLNAQISLTKLVAQLRGEFEVFKVQVQSNAQVVPKILLLEFEEAVVHNFGFAG